MTRFCISVWRGRLSLFTSTVQGVEWVNEVKVRGLSNSFAMSVSLSRIAWGSHYSLSGFSLGKQRVVTKYLTRQSLIFWTSHGVLSQTVFICAYQKLLFDPIQKIIPPSCPDCYAATDYQRQTSQGLKHMEHLQRAAKHFSLLTMIYILVLMSSTYSLQIYYLVSTAHTSKDAIEDAVIGLFLPEVLCNPSCLKL